VESHRWQQVRSVFDRARACPPEERATFLDDACQGDASLRREVVSLLAAYESADSFLESPPVVTSAPTEIHAAAPPTGRRPSATDERGAPATGVKRCSRCDSRFDASHLFCPHDGEVLTDDPLALVGTTLDGLYSIEAFVGEGGMGAVYRARHILLRDVVAVKVLPRAVSESEQWLRRFQREGQAARRFRHPNAVTVYDLRTSERGLVYLVLEYVDGPTLRSELERRGRYRAAEALAVLEPLASALDAAHASGVVHRDLKPDNVMFGRGAGGEQVVKLLDLGIAKLVEAEEDTEASMALTRTGMLLGTPLYMAPEQWGEPQRDGNPEIDGRADVYGLGVMAYEMVCGARPFTGLAMSELRREHAASVPPAPHVRVEGLPEAYGEAIARAMAKDRGDRQKTPGELVRQLRIALAKGGAPGRPASPASQRANSVDWSETEVAENLDPGDEQEIDTLLWESGGQLKAPELGDSAPTLISPELGATLVASNLPQQITSFIGREEEIAGVRRALSSARLLTLTGPGGVGKTRLALEVASRAAGGHPHGVWFVELAPLTDASFVEQAVADALGVREDTGISLSKALLDHLRSKRLLLVLDNCEHLIEACASFAEAVLQACPHVRLLATSREVFDIPGENVWQVPSLPVPDPDALPPLEELSGYGAVRLFIERASAKKTGLALNERNARAIASVCRQLDGIPLAIELAAARVQVLSVEQILAKMDDRFRLLTGGGRTKLRRQQTLRAAIDWSHDLLTEDERALLRRLSVFAGGWTLEAAEAICDGDVLDLLTRLINKSLVVAEELDGEARYRMLETIRQYAREKLGEAGEEEWSLARHGEWFLQLAERADTEMDGPEQSVWFARLEAEHDNLRAVLQRSAPCEEDVEGYLRLCNALAVFWYVRGHVSEGRKWIEGAITRCATAPAPLRARTLYRASILVLAQGDRKRGEAFLSESLAAYRELGDTHGTRRVLLELGFLQQDLRDYDRASATCAEALELSRELGDRTSAAAAQYYLGLIALGEGDCNRAQRWLDESLAGHRSVGNKRGTAAVLHSLGECARQQGELGRAGEHLEECMEIARELGDTRLVADSLNVLGGIANDQGEHARALALHKSALATHRSLEDRLGMAYALEGIACAVAHARPQEALRIAGAASQLREAIQSPPSPAEQKTLDRGLSAAREAEGPERVGQLFDEGRALDPAHAIATALECGAD
jgi:predicted ATPase/serine/threonine protein kinase